MNEQRREYPERPNDQLRVHGAQQDNYGRAPVDHYDNNYPEEPPFEDITSNDWSGEAMAPPTYQDAPFQNAPYQDQPYKDQPYGEATYQQSRYRDDAYYNQPNNYGSGPQGYGEYQQAGGPRQHDMPPRQDGGYPPHGGDYGRASNQGYSGGREAGQGRPAYRRGSPEYQKHSGHALSKILDDFSGFFKGFFSTQPANALKQDLSTASWVILLVVNILFYAIAKATVFVKSGLGILDNLNDIFSTNTLTTGGSGWGKAFGLGILEHILVVLLLFLAAWLFSGMSGEKKLPTVQYIKLVSYATPIHTLVSFIIIFIALFAPMFAMQLLVMNIFLLFFSFAYIFDSVYAKERKSRYWVYLILFFLLSVLSILF